MTQKMLNIRHFVQRLRTDTSGLAMIEFAYSLPLLTGIICYGLELSNLAMANHQVSQAASALADNMSRVGLMSALSQTQIRESDVNDSFAGVERQTGTMNILTNGRVILSSLQQNPSGGQWIPWQRCIGSKAVTSSYGVQGDGATGTAFPGMGPASARVQAPPGTAVMFVEVIYDFKPWFAGMFIPSKTIRSHASFIVRDERELAGPSPADPDGIFNPTPTAPQRLCSIYSAT